METQQMKIVKELPDNMTGHIVVFENPLIVHQQKEVRTKEIMGGKKTTCITSIPTGKTAKCYFMRVEGGFGAYSCCSGRMLIGKFYKTIQDVLDNKPFDSGNTKCYPNGYLSELFTEHEKL